MKKHLALGFTCLVLGLHAQAEELTGTLKKIKSTGAITIGHREASIPFSYVDDKKQPIGYSIELCMKVVDKIKSTLNMPDLPIKYQLVDSANRIGMVKNGTVDIECGSTTNNLKRQQDVAFSYSTFITSLKFISKTGSSVKTIDDLKGKTVVVTAGSSAVPVIKALNDSKGLGMNVINGKDHADSFSMVDSGSAVAFFEDDVLLAGLRASAKQPSSYVLTQETFSNDPYGLMLRKDDAPFKRLVDDALGNVMKSGEIERIYFKWFMSPLPAKGISMNLPMSARLREAFKAPNDKASD